MKKIAVIGGGVAGLEVAKQLLQANIPVTLIEQSSKIGGNIKNYAYLFPDFYNAEELLNSYHYLITDPNLQLLLNTEVAKIDFSKKIYNILTKDGISIPADAIVIATGYNTFDARLKEEFGYGIYENVITSVQLEQMFKNKDIKTPSGKIPERIGFIHCVGSRDAKVGNTYCSRLCCVTAIKQAIETKKLLPSVEIFCFYIDLRMYGLLFEDLYLSAQRDYNIQFVRGRLSEASEMLDKRIQIKAEDTLIGKPLQMTADMIVLMVGMEASDFSKQFKYHNGLEVNEHGFFNPINPHNLRNLTSKEGIFLAGTAIGPMSVGETLDHARGTALSVLSFINAN